MSSKVCTKCKQLIDLSGFYSKGRRKSGEFKLSSICKSCENKRTTAKRKAHPEIYRERAKEYYYKFKREINRKNVLYWKKIRETDPQRAHDKYRRSYYGKKEKAPHHFMWWSAKSRARKKNIDFTIKKEDIIVPKLCPVLGIPIDYAYGKIRWDSPTLDRINITKGYTPDNIAVISWKANSLKRDALVEELRLVLKYMEKHNCP